jgi:hypothetical protein
MSAVKWSTFLESIAWNSPMLLVFLVGIFMSLAWMMRNPLPSILTLIGCGLLFVGRSANLVFQYFRLSGDPDWNTSAMKQLMIVVNTGVTMSASIGFALIIAAIFLGRNKPSAEEVKNL